MSAKTWTGFIVQYRGETRDCVIREAEVSFDPLVTPDITKIVSGSHSRLTRRQGRCKAPRTVVVSLDCCKTISLFMLSPCGN